MRRQSRPRSRSRSPCLRRLRPPASSGAGGQKQGCGGLNGFSARKYHRHRKAHRARSAVRRWPCKRPRSTPMTAAWSRPGFPVFHVEQVSTVAVSGDVRVIGGRPAGCPHRYCACALSCGYSAGSSPASTGANWPRRFALTAPAPSMVAAGPATPSNFSPTSRAACGASMMPTAAAANPHP